MEEMKTRVAALLAEKDFRELKAILSQLYPVDIAELFAEFEAKESVVLFRLLHKEQAAEVFSYLGTEQRRDIVGGIRPGLLEDILNDLYFDDKIDFLEEMPANFVKQVLSSASPEERGLMNQFLSYPENSAGSLMTIEFVDLKKGMTVKQALQRIKALAMDSETVYTCYVLDDSRRLEGLVSLRRLVVSEPDVPVSELMSDKFIAVSAQDDQEQVADQFKKYDLMAVPVVDSERRLVGIITIDDIVDVIEQENTEDFQRMAALAPSEDAYLDSGVFKLAKQRVPWLLILMISATFTSNIINHYEALLGAAVALSAFIPMLMDSGGNSGSQSSTLIIRGMALGEITLRDWYRVLFKEFRVGLIAGAILATVNFVWLTFTTAHSVAICFTVSLALMFTIVLAKLVGGILPIIAKALRLDPAIMAGPLITTVVDALSLIVYFSIASALVL